MPRPLVDLGALDLERDVVPEDELRSLLPHRHEFQLIDGICHLDVEEGVVVGYKRWDENAWWGRGHIPGRPLMPGVLLAESAAQVATVLMKKHEGAWALERFIGLAGLDSVRFRGQITPPATIYLVSRAGPRSGNRLARYPAQALCDGQICMDMTLLGALL
ncbi:MAG: beta-hydroxyacyl-ACP dehydratase [Planctomycetes bacterium]|nr:beta-hydroxyacyl-ACP dehydratase [Planctomycetota bacterium]